MSCDYRELKVWQKAMLLVKQTYMLTKMLPDEERFGLIPQMRRAAVSIPSNIAEGQSRGTEKEYCHFLSVARGSKSELYTQLSICCMLAYLNEERASDTMYLCEEVGKMIHALMNKLNAN